MNLRFLLRSLLPRRRTTEAKALEAIVSCGINPDEIAWRVEADGSFIFGRKSPVDDGLTYEQMECLLEWADSERVRTSVIGWETRQG
jgi:hypothetical protein